MKSTSAKSQAAHSVKLYEFYVKSTFGKFIGPEITTLTILEALKLDFK